MIARRAAVAAVGVLLALQANARAERAVAAASPAARAGSDRHHYSISARVRPLLVFWLTRDGVGDAVVIRRRAPGHTRYSLLIGSDPQRAPRSINRWGYIEEEIHGVEARLIGLMTESDEESIEEAEANLRQQAAGRHPFKVIQATVNGEHASSLVRSIAAPRDYTFRDVHTVLDLARRESSGGNSRVIQLPPGTRPGFLAALADAMHAPSASPITYVYHGRLYELRRVHAQMIPNFQLGRASFGSATAADFVITSTHDGEQTRFSMTYGIDERFKEVPLKVTYQPRWWMQVELTLDDVGDDPALTDGVVP